jgi:hypothetical protein
MRRWLTTLLARLTKNAPSGPPRPLGWNGRPLSDAAPDLLPVDPPVPAADYGTLNLKVVLDGGPPPHAPIPRAE